jgi:predicted HNH restriction endonuclease
MPEKVPVIRKFEIEEEIGERAKCDVMCANCHRIVEWEKSHDAS